MLSFICKTAVADRHAVINIRGDLSQVEYLAFVGGLEKKYQSIQNKLLNIQHLLTKMLDHSTNITSLKSPCYRSVSDQINSSLWTPNVGPVQWVRPEKCWCFLYKDGCVSEFSSKYSWSINVPVFFVLFFVFLINFPQLMLPDAGINCGFMSFTAW